MFPSSKSIIFSDEKIRLADSLHKKNQVVPLKRKKSELMMSSSKSGPVIKPEQFRTDYDTIRTDTLKFKRAGQ